VAIGLAAAIAAVGGGFGVFAGGRGQGTQTAEPAACGSRGQPSGEMGTVASKAPWHVRLGPGESLKATPANVKASRRGRPLVISGHVLAASCATPLVGATVHVWQTNGDGEYGPSRGTEIRCCYLQGTMTTDARGRYRFETVKPGLYGGPAHIHFQVRDQHGHELTTELLFADDPSPGAQGRGGAIRLTKATSGDRSYLRGTFDIVLPAA
jgi:protocatechuate 3,4-dioxygenase beta subunit